MHRHISVHTCMHAHTHTYTHTEGEGEGDREAERERETDRHTNIQRERQREWQLNSAKTTDVKLFPRPRDHENVLWRSTSESLTAHKPNSWALRSVSVPLRSHYLACYSAQRHTTTAHTQPHAHEDSGCQSHKL